MKLSIPMQSGTAAGTLVRSGYVTLPLLVFYGLFAVPFGMSMAHYAASMVLLIMAAAALIGIGIFINEHGRLAFVPFADGADDDIRECMPAMVSQCFALAVAIGAPVMAVLITTGHATV